MTWPSNGADIDPDIRRFIRAIGESYAAHPPLSSVSPNEARAISEIVRHPWTQGGPTMARTTEHRVPTPHGNVRVRVHTPAAASRSALIYLHGGGWIMFSIDTHDRLMREYAARAGMTVIGVDYALAPEHRFPVALDQIVAIVDWARIEASALGIDFNRIALGGDSAGGNLALATALRMRDCGEPARIKALLLNYGAFDDRTSDDYTRRYGGPAYMLTEHEMRHFWAGYLTSDADRSEPLAVPARASLGDLPSVYLTIPECDVLTDQSLSLAQRLRSAQVSCVAAVYPGATHSFLEAVSISLLAERAIAEGANWLRRQLTE